MTYRKKLIEVALPLEVINCASAEEKAVHSRGLSKLNTSNGYRGILFVRLPVQRTGFEGEGGGV